MPPPPHHLDSCDRGMALGRWCPTVIAKVGCTAEILTTSRQPNDGGNNTAPSAGDAPMLDPRLILRRANVSRKGGPWPGMALRSILEPQHTRRRRVLNLQRWPPRSLPFGVRKRPGSCRRDRR